jgi:hypothetical protein
MQTVPKITALQAQAIANQFLSDHLPDRFTADQPTLAEDIWQVPVILAYPSIGSLGIVGEIWVSAATESMVSHTELATIKAAGLHLYEIYQNAIETAFS